MPIAALAGAFAGSAVFMLLQWFSMKMTGYSEDGWMYRYVIPVMQSGVFGYLFTTIACHIAPWGKIITGVVMVTILGVVLALLLIFAWSRPDVGVGEAVNVTIHAIAMLLASIATLVNLHADEPSW